MKILIAVALLVMGSAGSAADPKLEKFMLEMFAHGGVSSALDDLEPPIWAPKAFRRGE